ncbi:MAG: ClpX C4-type zinc finger protein, partial [Lachnospiraceae bacterium]|nr:ClpX C4-type zinc finger protein [Lachnospiraceae bacterium]
MSDDERIDENKKDEGSWDFRELNDVEEQKKELLDKQKDSGSQDDNRKDDYEEVCFICRRPESKAGKMFKLPNHICVCNDCMHKTMDTV